MKKSVEIDVNLAPLLGIQDENLMMIEKELNVRVLFNHDGVELHGPSKGVRKAAQIFYDYAKLVQSGMAVEEYNFGALLELVLSDPNASLFNVGAPGKEKPTGKVWAHPRNASQREYIATIKDNDITFGVGPAGTGKTYLAVAMAVAALTEKQVKRLVLVRPVVEAGEKLGFLPGTLQEKIDPYLRPLYDALYEMLGPLKVKDMMEKGIIEIAPLAYMRGRTIKDSFIIADEAQNTTTEQMKMLLTRLGEGSKMIVNGDVTQIDLPKHVGSGLHDAIKKLSDVEGVAFHEFNQGDVVRHKLVQSIVAAYEKYD